MAKLNKDGRVTVPKEFRSDSDISDESRARWRLGDDRAIQNADVPIPNRVESADEFWAGVKEALDQAALGTVRDARPVSDGLRLKYAL